MWYVRCWYELKEAQNAWFVTLTYDDESLPYGDGLPTLHKEDIQLFIKRLRKRLKTKLKYYAVGEYGEQFERPHYHVLFFNLLNNKVATEKLLEETWTTKSNGSMKPLGLVHVGEVTPASINYALKYIIQDYKDNLDREKPFSLMSKRPPIGSFYYTNLQMVQYHKDDVLRSYCTIEGKKYPLPRLYREKLYGKYERYLQNQHMTDVINKKNCLLAEKEGAHHGRNESDRVERFRARINKSRKSKGKL